MSNVDWVVGPGDRIGIVGGNGAGKSTLLRVLAGAQPLDGGEFRVGSTVRTAFLTQELTELPSSTRVLEAVEEVARRVNLGGRDLSAAQLAEVFGFTESRLWTPVADLSGGERRRLQLLRLLAGEPNVLLLDEPTNDLDTDTLASLEDLLDTWPGTMVIASHDRYLVERVCDTVYALYGDGRLTHLPGGVEEYLASASLSAAVARAVPAPTPKPGADSVPPGRSWPAWSAGSEGWSSARPCCTSSWPATQRTTRRSRCWTSSCGQSRPSGSAPRPSGWSWPTRSVDHTCRGCSGVAPGGR